jgi:serine/threonine-protein kinase HipA
MARLTIQAHHHGDWHDAATIEIHDPAAGIASPSVVDYVMDYVPQWDHEGLETETPAQDNRALSVVYPVDFVSRTRPSWPPFLLDMLPQGPARRRLAQKLGYDNPDARDVELPLLLLGGGCPIGNLRIKEAWQEERKRLADQTFKGLTTDEVLGRSDRFGDVVDRFALLASGSSGVQGDWPKVLLTRANDGLWYPDPLVEDDAARAHTIVKLLRDREPAYSAILAAEAPYLEVARAFDLRVGKALTHAEGILVIPRFDRDVTAGRVVRYGQESLVSAIGVSAFGHVGVHEHYLAIVKKVSDNPRKEVIEYVLRDLLNFAMGNPDNHGRNTALQKRADGSIGLTPLFDFTPMRLDPTTIVRSTRWKCLNGRDAEPDWGLICDAAAEGVMDPAELRAVLAAKANFLHALPETARDLGVADRTIERACAQHEEAARAVEALARGGM